jgi:hypothetical protein
MAASPSTNRDGHAPASWEQPLPLRSDYAVPPFPVETLPPWLAEWVAATAEATQTPADLAAMLALAISGAAVAKKFRVLVRDGWSEPLNLFAVVALLPGERKSAVFADASAPVLAYEREEQIRMAVEIAEAASEHRMMEARLKAAETKAAKAEDLGERDRFRAEAMQLARDVAAHVVPDPPRMLCDDETPENLARLLARQGGRMLQASAEGTAFEIAKGRYSETANFDVYLKGHAGDSLRVGRISREADIVEQPALSVALAVQPDVIRGLVEQSSMRGRGFLARFLYSVPVSKVGARKARAAAVSNAVETRYADTMLRLWHLEGRKEAGKPSHHWLRLTPTADNHIEALQRWLEPQLAEGAELAHLGGWANKLAGAVARISGILHLAATAGGGPDRAEVDEHTVAAAVRIGRDYLLPHALAAFGLMGADEKLEKARQVWESVCRLCECSEYGENAPPSVSRRDIHQANRRAFPSAEQLDPVLDLLVREGYLRSVDGSGQPGKGHRSPMLLVNPLALAASQQTDPCTHRTHWTHSEE